MNDLSNATADVEDGDGRRYADKVNVPLPRETLEALRVALASIERIVNGSSAKIVAALLIGVAALVIGIVVLVAATDPNARTCPPGKSLVIMPAGKVSVPECV